MALGKITGVRACMDCITYSANGAGELDPATVERVRAGLDGFGVRAEVFADSDPDTGEWTHTGFTSHPCEVCGLALGHDYVRGTVLHEIDGGQG